MRNKVSMQDIANQLGVSKVTVSKALNDKDGVSAPLRRRIKETAQQLGYVLGKQDKALSGKSVKLIAVLIPQQFTTVGSYEMDHGIVSFYMEFYQIISRYLADHGYSAVLSVLSPKEEKEGRLPDLIQQSAVHGILVIGQLSMDYVRVIQQTDIAHIFLDFYENDFAMDSVTIDNYQGAYMLTNYLVQEGFKRFAFVGNVYATSSIQDRFLGFLKSVLEHGLPMSSEYILSDRDEEGDNIPLSYPEQLPEVFVCNCDKMANWVIRDMKQLGLRVPQDISVVGFDNSIYSTLSTPAITTVEVDTMKMARMGIEALFRKMKNPEDHCGKIAIEGNIVYRSSVASKGQ